MKIGLYPGSFDPISMGHLDIIERASTLFDVVHVGVLKNSTKQGFFSVEDRIRFIEQSTKHLKNVEVSSFDGLTVKYAHKLKANAVIRGLRAVSDFEYEFQMAAMNNKLSKDAETVFFMTSTQYSFLSSSIIKEVGKLGGCIEGLVPDCIFEEVRDRLLQK